MSWRYTFAAVPDGTEVTERWEMLPASVAVFQERYGVDADREIADRTRAAHDGIPTALAAMKRIVAEP